MEKQLTVCFLDVAGMSCDGDTYKHSGLGGSESAYVYLSEEFTKLGWKITIYNKCENAGDYNGVTYFNLSQASQDTNIYDILIVSRSVLPFLRSEMWEEIRKKYGFDPAPFANIVKNAKYKILWLHDTFIKGDAHLEHAVLDGLLDEIFTLSDWHTHYITKAYHGEGTPRRFEQLKHKIFVTRNGIRNHINFVDIKKKNPNLYIYNASISKGLHEVIKIVWPEVRKLNPNAELICIGGYYILQKGYVDGWTTDWHKLYEDYNGKDGITLTGIIPQHEIARIYEKATYMLYPGCFPETFGISTLEAINYNVLPIVQRFGALEEIAPEECSYITEYGFNEVPGLNADQSKLFQLAHIMQQVQKAYNDPYLRQQKQYACDKFKPWIGWDKVALEWQEHIYNKLGLYMNPEKRLLAKEATYNYLRLFNRTNINQEAKIIERELVGEERPIVIISPFYNAEKYLANHINSVANQMYNNYIHIMINDLSTDNSLMVIHETVKQLPINIRGRFLVKTNAKKTYALGNQIETLENLANLLPEQYSHAIIVLLDGDDWLTNKPDIFTYLNYQYNKGIKFTYGSCHSIVDNINLYAQTYPPEIMIAKKYREYLFNWGMPYTHLRTFAYSLYNDENLCKDIHNDVFDAKEEPKYKAGGDNYLFYKIIERCNPEEIMAIGEIFVEYNDDNPLNDYKVNRQEQNNTAKNIRNSNIIAETKIIDKNVVNINDIAQVEILKDKIVNAVRAHNPEAVAIYKDIATKRIDVWDENPESIFITPRYEWIKNYLLTHYPNKNIHILDVGAWTGTFAQLIYDLGYKNITCLDIGENIVAKGKELRPYFRWAVGDIENFNFYDKYDIILMCEVAEHLVEPIKTIIKLRNTTLKPNGAILYSIPTESVVFGDKLHNRSSEHISKITYDELKELSTIINTIYSDNNDIANAYEWYIGAIMHTSDSIKDKILIAIPTMKYIESETFKSIYDLEKPKNTETVFQFFYGYDIAQVRNLIAHWATNNNFNFVFHVDSDIILPKDALVKLYNMHTDIVSGVYIQRKENKIIPEIYVPNAIGGMSNIEAARLTNKDINPFQITGCGFGCVLIDINVYKRIPYPQFEYHHAIKMEDTVSEDIDFCMKASNAGCQIWVEPSVKCIHIGNRYFNI
jgi:2-polyprenyl-3-methyl-5-hydroxy-6-metoxy-1,4-benzoquinol methylase/GT2 family glycosyltransferase